MTGPWKRKVTIGDCTLYLGDCREIMPVIAKVDHVVSDPPYEHIMHKAKAATARRLRTDGRAGIKPLGFASIDGIRQEIATAFAEISNGWSIVFCSPEGVGRWADAINNSKAKYKRACVWVKPDSTPQLNGQGPAMGAENFVVSWCGPGFARWNAGGKRGVYTHCVNGPTREGTHPTEKPTSLMREIMADFTCQGEAILDPFMGSGTTGVACVQLGRKFVGIEIDETYFDTACKRIADAVSRPRLDLGEPVAKPKQEAFAL